jgi:hypothetical protein
MKPDVPFDVFIFEKKIDNIQGNYYINGKDVTKLFYHKKETKNSVFSS